MRVVKSTIAVLALSIGMQAAIIDVAWGAEFDDCVRDASAKDVAVRTQFQRDSRNLIVQNRPAYDTLATLNMELQVALAELQQARLEFLLKYDPGQINVSEGLSRFGNVEWSTRNSALFAEESSKNRELVDRISTLADRNNGHADWPGMRGYFSEELAQGPEFEAIMSRFQTGQGDVEAAIARCSRD